MSLITQVEINDGWHYLKAKFFQITEELGLNQRYATTLSEIDINSLHEICSSNFSLDISDASRSFDGRLWAYLSEGSIVGVIRTMSEYSKNSSEVMIHTKDPSVSRNIGEMLERNTRKISHDDGKVPVNFWHYTEQGPTYRRRELIVPTWNDIKKNYTNGVLESISSLSLLKPDDSSGRLIIFHGKPGTGKTFVIRSLIREWKTWCSANYILDPEVFFGKAAYMYGSIVNNIDDYPDVAAGRVALEKPKQWQLFIFEDANEFLVKDAKGFVGQGFSRLLNIANGLVGQGLNILLILTTNEPLENLHEAVAREGRCLANVEFPKFPHSHAKKWLEDEGIMVPDGDVPTSPVLADLFAIRNKRKRICFSKRERPVGFGE